jgi:hypothetical protein
MSQVSALKQNARRSSQSLRGRVALTVVQVALGTVCGVGAFVGVTLALSGTPESLGEYVRLARVETWPEIKDGVPALIPLPASAPRSGAPTAELAHGMPEPTAAASDPLSSLPVPDPPPAQPIFVEPVAAQEHLHQQQHLPKSRRLAMRVARPDRLIRKPNPPA